MTFSDSCSRVLTVLVLTLCAATSALGQSPTETEAASTTESVQVENNTEMSTGVEIVSLESMETTATEAWTTGTTVTPSLPVIDKLMPDSVSKPRAEGEPVDTIVLHFTSEVTLHPDDPFDVDRMIDTFTTYGVSAHYLIDRDGTIYRLVDEERQAFHAGRGELPFQPRRRNSLNKNSIGIEMFAIGSKRDMKIFMSEDKYEQVRAAHPEFIGFTDAQYEALDALIDDVITRYPDIQRDRRHIIGHEEYARIRRTDPGELFDWTQIGLTKERN